MKPHVLFSAFEHDQKLKCIVYGRCRENDRVKPVQNAAVSRNDPAVILDIVIALYGRCREIAEYSEHRTDGTDAFDTLYIGAEKFPYRDAFSINVSGGI